MKYFFAAAAVGIFAEIIAYSMKFWLYRKPLFPVVNVFVMFGVLMGLLASRIDENGVFIVALAAFAIGYIYELANFRLLHWWSFPDQKFLVFRGEQGCSVSVALLWAATPILSWLIVKTIF